MDSLSINNLLSVLDHPLYKGFVEQRLSLMRSAGVHLYCGDARNRGEVQAVAADFGPTAIVHLAAISSAVSAESKPRLAWEIQLGTLVNTLEVAASIPCLVVYLSSSMVYGNFTTSGVTESTTLNPQTWYGEMKYFGERMVRRWHRRYGFPVTIVRPSALYGERCISRRVAQVFIEQAITGEPVRLEGGGSGRLDFTYIRDLVDGLTLALEQPPSTSETFNLTYGEAQPVRALFDLLVPHFPKLVAHGAAADPLKPVRGTLSVEHARKVLGYAPQWPLERGYPQYIDWYREQSVHDDG